MAETGHLVFSTLHTNDAAQAIDRIIDVFPAFRQEQIRVQLAASLGAVIAQRLVPRIGGGMVAAFEILVANNPVRNLIREGKTNQLLNVITTNQQEGMCTLEASLVDLIRSDVVTYDDAHGHLGTPQGARPPAEPPGRHALDCVNADPPHTRPQSPVLARGRGHAVPRRLAGRRAPSSRARSSPPRTRFGSRPSSTWSTAPGLFDHRAERPRRRSRPGHRRRANLRPRGPSLLGPPRLRRQERAGRGGDAGRHRLLPDNLDAISRTLLPRYQEVAREMAPFRQRTIYEVNADLSFYQLNGDVPMRWSKHSEKGIEERQGSSSSEGARRPQDPRRRGSRGQLRRTCSTRPRSCGRPGGSSPRPPSASPSIPSGTSRVCGWRSFARTDPPATGLHSDEWWVKGRSSSGPAKTATAQPSARKTP